LSRLNASRNHPILARFCRRFSDGLYAKVSESQFGIARASRKKAGAFVAIARSPPITRTTFPTCRAHYPVHDLLIEAVEDWFNKRGLREQVRAKPVKGDDA
jgi:hypothetical protein